MIKLPLMIKNAKQPINLKIPVMIREVSSEVKFIIHTPIIGVIVAESAIIVL